MLDNNTNKVVWVGVAVGVVALIGAGSLTLFPDAFSGMKDTISSVMTVKANAGRNYIRNSNRTLVSQVDANDTGWVNTSIPISELSNKVFTMSVQVDYDNVTAITSWHRIGLELVAIEVKPDGSYRTRYLGVWRNPKVGESFHGRISKTFDMRGTTLKSVYTPNHWGQGLYIQGMTATNVSVSNPKLEMGKVATDWSPAPEDSSSATAKS